MIILDTSVWVEHLRNNPIFFPKISNLLERREILAVECIFGELLQGVKNKSEKEIIVNFWTYLPKKNYENIIIQAGEYSAKNKLLEPPPRPKGEGFPPDHGVSLVDVIILMHGIKSNSKIWTLDNEFLKIIPEELRYIDSVSVA